MGDRHGADAEHQHGGCHHNSCYSHFLWHAGRNPTSIYFPSVTVSSGVMILWFKSMIEFLVPQIEYPLGGSSKKCSHVYFLLLVAMVLLLWRQIVLLWHQVTVVASEQHLYQTIVLPTKLATGNIHDFLFCYCSLVGILFEVLRIEMIPILIISLIFLLSNLNQFSNGIYKSYL